MTPKTLTTALLVLIASPLLTNCSSNPTPAVPASDADSVIYIKWPYGGVSVIPQWVSESAASSDGRISTEYFTESGISTLDYWPSLPFDAEEQCYPVDYYFDLYGVRQSPETAKAIVHVEVVEQRPGFGRQSPGTLFRGRIRNMPVALPRSHKDLTYVDFFMPIGRVQIAGDTLCPRDRRFPSLKVGDDAILLVENLYEGSSLLSVGDGGVLVFRDGRLVREGDAVTNLPSLPTDLDRALREIKRLALMPDRLKRRVR